MDALRDADSVARMGGDKFVIVLETVDNVSDIEAIADKLLEVVCAPLTINKQHLKVSMSIGISLYPEHGLTVDQLLLQSDVAMHQAKADGRNTFRFYDEDLNHASANDLLFENELHQALINNELRLYYQPQVSLIDSRVTGLEALIRWQHPERGLLSPAHFVPLAEESGLIEPIGLWIIEEAAKQFKSWLKQGFDFGRVAVNLSVRQIREQSFAERLIGALNKTGLHAQYIELEVTESSTMENAAETITALKALSDHGFSLSVDDFGTGYSSLSYLKRFPLTKVKIDRSFLDDINSVEYDATIAKSIIHLANEMSLDVLAEGVEREVQSQWLLKHGCYLAQGYFYSKPLSGKELIILAKDSNQRGGSVFLK